MATTNSLSASKLITNKVSSSSTHPVGRSQAVLRRSPPKQLTLRGSAFSGGLQIQICPPLSKTVTSGANRIWRVKAQEAVVEEEPIYYTKNKTQKVEIQDWYDDLIATKKVKQVFAEDMEEAVGSGFQVLDIRPTFEHRLAHIEGSIHCPFWMDAKKVKKTAKKSLGIMIGGSMSPSGATCSNVNFMEDLAALGVKKDAKLIICCMGGCRSLFAVKALYDAGFSNLAWLDRGFYSLDPDPEPSAKDGNGNLVDKEKEGPVTFDGASPNIIGLKVFGSKGRITQLYEAVSTSFNTYPKDYMVYEGQGIYNKKKK
mmetsp:Transcript_20341/g.24388  ORF Transcript_20341/g.24388 Transcript_20341/m.24388 type:complete len:313 (+) Transcript_20341:146-1084(+)|eukprot:CAMPEP_0197854626 /NCGR_PEP_ID=MMETSP1438-20131217/25015_1 /TAXON_ID=1461541 /ORGANISM="Pterosperma sp., Strain CCMP1384" /LENGTH=312 /DNA_ID=CAMNT_0043469427 /DNA_START=139 /DNA_END=1077 /DNA_ORIENTATION=+